METSTASETRTQRHARFGTLRAATGPVACAFARRAGSFEALRAASICEKTNGIVARQDDLEGLSQALDRFARGAALSVSMYEEPRDDPSAGLVAISFTLG